MKTRKNLLLSKKAVARGEKLAAARHTSLSTLIERQLLATTEGGEIQDYWNKPTPPIPRPGDARYEYLKKKHG